LLALWYLYLTKSLHLALSHHTCNVCRAAYFHIRALCHIRPSLAEDMATTVAVSMVHSLLDYANSLVHSHTNVKRLQSVQNFAARVVLKDNHNLSSGNLLRKLHWLPVQSRTEFKIACITYKVLTTGQPTYLSNLLNHYTPLRTLRSANQYHLQHPRVSTEFAKRSFSYLTPKIWNNIPVFDIRLYSTLPTFKHHLKTYLFKQHLHFTPAILLA